MDYNRLADLLFPNLKYTLDSLEAQYPPRALPEGAAVTRFAPSPTGYVHLGNMYSIMLDERQAHKTGGVFVLRIEDTDQKREIKNGVAIICDALKNLGINFDEGATADGDNGVYGPYRQRPRVDIYHTVAKEFVKLGRAYPCFCTEEELTAMRQAQKAEKANFGYWGKWAKHRDGSIEKIEAELKKGTPYVLRFKSEGDVGRKFKYTDLVKGDLELTQNDIDHVMLKADGIPTYHFAHVVDDHFMRVTHVFRDESWLPSFPLHFEMLSVTAALGWKRSKYGHHAQIMKLDGSSKRKLSKRKDPEADLRFFPEHGYYMSALIDYLMTIINSNYEEWRRANPTETYDKFNFSLKKLSVSGAIFDLDKLNSVSRNMVSLLDAGVVLSEVLAWSKTYDPELFALLSRDEVYAKAILSIGRGMPNPRKDFGAWSEVKPYISFFFDELFVPDNAAMPQNVSATDRQRILSEYAQIYDAQDGQTEWFNKIKALAERLGFAPGTKEYKLSPEKYKGHVGDVSMVLRVAVTGRQNSPDMYEVMRHLGKDKVIARLKNAL